MPFSKPQVSFSSTFKWLFSVMKYTPLYFFFCIYTLLKRNQSKCKFFRLFTAQIKIHQVLVIFQVSLQILHHSHSAHLGISPLKNTTSLFLSKPPLNRQTVQAPSLFRQSLLYPLYWFFVNPPKSRIFHWTSKILKFFILNTILSFKGN